MTEPTLAANSENKSEAVPPSEQQPLVGVRGWLLLFCITLFFRAAITLLSSLKGINSGDSYEIAGGLMYLVLAGICLVAGVQVCRRRKAAIRWAIASMLLTTAYAALTIMRTGTAGVSYLFSSVVYMGIWWTYLVESNRVKATLNL